MHVFINAKLVLPDKILDDAWLIEDKGLVIDYGTMPVQLIPECNELQTTDCGGLYLSPGFIDMHTHGAGGYDFMDGTPESVVKAAQMHLKHGTTSLLPTTMTSTDQELFDTIDAYLQVKASKTENMPNLLGMHLEGPYFSPHQAGAQPLELLRVPDADHYNRILDRAQGEIKRWSIAPELDGCEQLASELRSRNILLSVGHSNANYEEMCKAVQMGFSFVTHLYSGMSTITRKDGFRVLGVVESAFLSDALSVEIIADGIHLPTELLQLIVKCKSINSICLVTDSMRGAGLGDGNSILGSKKSGMEVIVEDGIAKMPDRTCFAGSVATADRLIRVMTQNVGIDMHTAIRMMTKNPADVLGIGRTKGSVEVGKEADLILFDKDINICQAYINGTLAYDTAENSVPTVYSEI